MAEKSESARTTIILALSTALLGFFVLDFGLQTLVSFEAHRWAWASPFLSAVPQPLPTSVASTVQEKNLSSYGMNFDAPWKGSPKETEGDARSEFEFPSGPIIVLFNPQSELDTVGEIRGGDPQTYSRFESIFGTGFFSSNYALYAAVYSAAPGQISPFTPRSKAVRLNELFIWKLRFGTGEARIIYSVQFGKIRGFQLGDPSHERAVVVQLFDENDKQLRLLFASKTGQPGTISQSDINCVLDSLRPVPTIR